MDKVIQTILRIDGNIRKFYYMYMGVFSVIIVLFFVAILLWSWSLKILLGIWVVIGYFTLFLPCMKDFSNALKGKYSSAQGRIYEQEKAIENWRVINIINKKGKCIKKINVLYKSQLNNSYGIIEYLPHTKFGKIKELQENKS